MGIEGKSRVVRIIAAFVLVCVIAVSLFLALYTFRSVTPFVEAVPQNIVFYVGIADLSSFVNEFNSTLKSSALHNTGISSTINEIKDKIGSMTDGQLAIAGRFSENMNNIDVLYIVRVNLIEAVYSRLDETLGGLSQAVDVYSDITIRNIKSNNSNLNYAFIGRILILSENIKFVRDSIWAIKNRNCIEQTSTFQQVCKKQMKGVISFCFVNLDLLSRYRSEQEGTLQRVLGYISDLLGDFDAAGCDITVGGVISIYGVLSYRPAVIDKYKTYYSKRRGIYYSKGISIESPPICKYLPPDMFCGVTFWTDMQDFWRQSLAQQDIETQKKIKEELALFNRDVLDKKDLERDLLPLLGPEWGIALAKVDYERFGIKTKYPIPALIVFIDLKDKWAGDKIREMLNYFVANIGREETKRGGMPPFTITEEKYKDDAIGYREGAIIRIKINGDEANAFGDAISPAIVIYKDAIIFSTFYPLLKEYNNKSVHSIGIGSDLALFVDMVSFIAVTRDMKEYIAQAIVNNRFRAGIEPEIEKEMSAKYDKSRIEAIKSEIRRGINLSQLPANSSLEKEVSYRFSKYLYEEKIQLIQKKLGDISQTQRYMDEIASAKDRIEHLINWIELINKLNVCVMFEQDKAVFSGTIFVTK